MKTRTLVDIRRLAGRTARIGTVAKGSQKPYYGAFSEFCGEKPCWGLGNPQMFKDSHPHLFDIAGAKHSFRDNAPGACPVPKFHGWADPVQRERPLESDGGLPAIPVRRSA